MVFQEVWVLWILQIKRILKISWNLIVNMIQRQGWLLCYKHGFPFVAASLKKKKKKKWDDRSYNWGIFSKEKGSYGQQIIHQEPTTNSLIHHVTRKFRRIYVCVQAYAHVHRCAICVCTCLCVCLSACVHGCFKPSKGSSYFLQPDAFVLMLYVYFFSDRV